MDKAGIDESLNSEKIKKWNLVNFCEINKFAIKSYCAIHNISEALNLGDISKIDEKDISHFDMMVWGFPCTDISIAGNQKGLVDENGNKTRSGLYYDGYRILKEIKPAVSIIENVKNLTTEKFKKVFDMIISDLDIAGYNSYYQILNSKDYGVPQNRERIYIVCIRKDLDNGKFNFPKKFINYKKLKDILENNVDNKYYISNEKTKQLALNTMNKDIKINKYESKIKENYKIVTAAAIRGRYKENGTIKQQIEISSREYANALTTVTKDSMIAEFNYYESLIKIRKITPREAFRLMGFSDDDFDAASKVVSASQLYKQAGNSIVVDVLYHTYIQLYRAMPYLFDNLSVGSFFSGIGAFESALDKLYININNSKIK